jgi:membrane protein YdbS with pleckstrin-like domain
MSKPAAVRERLTSKESGADPAQRDLAWTGYHPRAMAPAIALVGVASFLLWTGRWYLDDLSDLADRVGTLVVFATAWAVWPALVCVFLYRTVTFTYRLTDRALLIDFGFLAPPVAAIELSAVAIVTVGGGWVARKLGIGWIEVRTADRAVRLRGVREPALFAVTIRDAVGRAKERS